MKYTFFFFLFITNTLTWAQYLNPNDFPLVTEPIISYKTIDHNSESFLVTLDSTVYHFFRQDPGQTGNHTGNGGRIMMRTSNDNGDTWTNPVVIYDSQYDDRNVHGGITEDGRIIVTFRKYDALPQHILNIASCTLTTRTDLGRTFYPHNRWGCIGYQSNFWK
jgi:Neuraminidase (sialidase)